ncbi:hypothetical protein HNP49_002742 [Pseudomonas fluvialis]|uniref:Hydrolase or acyltransferase n=1 Tax=Pseudomonas fluvialis TaxID=1793966 RepID=A0A7X0EV82_9PSED|nr:alpha/beta hydrolase family protein [Pseudomonas fluvialis]MBB6342560.1 hypothetical protein [Pseudomonas fluvialis]
MPSKHLAPLALLLLSLHASAEEAPAAPAAPSDSSSATTPAAPAETAPPADDAAGGASGTDTTSSEAAPSEAPIRVEPAPVSVEQAQGLQNQLSADEQQQLKAGDESFLALWLPANAGTATGIVVIVPGDGESADWPQVVSPLRKKLPNAGWSTLSLTLPDPQAPSLPPRPEAAAAPASTAAEDAGAVPADSGTEAASAEAEDAPASPAADPATAQTSQQQSVFARIDAAVAAARQEKPERLVLLGHGSGAYWAAQYLSEKKPDDIQNLLLVSPQQPKGFTGNGEELLASLKLATGDFYYKDQAPDRQAALKRMQAGKRQQHPAYIQVAMKALPGNAEIEAEQLFRRIRGWLDLQIKAAP